MKKFLLTMLTVFCCFILANESALSQSNSGKRWKVGGVPAIAYDADMGFRYGGLINLYDHGPNMELFPRYRH